MNRTRLATGLMVGLGGLLTLAATTQPSPIAQTQRGLWEISGAPGIKAPLRQCVANVAALAEFEHRGKACTGRILKSSGSEAAVEYQCGGAGFGHSDINVLTPRSLRISTQGISGGLPFNYVVQARRVGDCQKNLATTRH